MISLLFRRFETDRKRRYKQLFIIIVQKMAKNHFLVIETQNNSRFSITHTYINTINYHYYIGMHHKISKQRVPCHLNTKSRLLNVRKYEKHRLKYAI